MSIESGINKLNYSHYNYYFKDSKSQIYTCKMGDSSGISASLLIYRCLSHFKEYECLKILRSTSMSQIRFPTGDRNSTSGLHGHQDLCAHHPTHTCTCIIESQLQLKILVYQTLFMVLDRTWSQSNGFHFLYQNTLKFTWLFQTFLACFGDSQQLWDPIG